MAAILQESWRQEVIEVAGDHNVREPWTILSRPRDHLRRAAHWWSTSKINLVPISESRVNGGPSLHLVWEFDCHSDVNVDVDSWRWGKMDCFFPASRNTGIPCSGGNPQYSPISISSTYYRWCARIYLNMRIPIASESRHTSSESSSGIYAGRRKGSTSEARRGWLSIFVHLLWWKHRRKEPCDAVKTFYLARSLSTQTWCV